MPAQSSTEPQITPYELPAELAWISGLPGSGVSTQGRALAAARGWSFVDVRDMLEAQGAASAWSSPVDQAPSQLVLHLLLDACADQVERGSVWAGFPRHAADALAFVQSVDGGSSAATRRVKTWVYLDAPASLRIERLVEKSVNDPREAVRAQAPLAPAMGADEHALGFVANALGMFMEPVCATGSERAVARAIRTVWVGDGSG